MKYEVSFFFDWHKTWLPLDCQTVILTVDPNKSSLVTEVFKELWKRYGNDLASVQYIKLLSN